MCIRTKAGAKDCIGEWSGMACKRGNGDEILHTSNSLVLEPCF